jgi:hypothetical protein
MYFTLAPAPPSANIAGGYSSRSRQSPARVAIPLSDSRRLISAPARSIVTSSGFGAPGADRSPVQIVPLWASWTCPAGSGYLSSSPLTKSATSS